MCTPHAGLHAHAQLARRPWLHQKQYVKIDALLKEGVPEHFRHRKLESEYATYFTDEH
jgi:hypothetical protein